MADDEQRSSRGGGYAALRAARDMAAQNTRVTIERVTRVIQSEREREQTPASSQTGSAAGQ